MSEIQQDKTERIIEAPQTQLVLEKKFVRRSKGDTTPSVLNVEKIEFHNTVPVLVTKFDDVQPGQEISMLGDGFTTIQNNAIIVTATGANRLLTAGLIYRFTHISGKLHEDASGVGGAPGAPGAAGVTGARGLPVIVSHEVGQVVEPFTIPGARGASGGAGAAGATGKTGQAIIIPGEPAQPLEPMMIPGKSGAPGVAGGAGAAGRAGQIIPGLDGRDAEEPVVIPGKDGKAGAAGVAGKTVFIPGIDGVDGTESFVPGPRGFDGREGGGFVYAGEWDAGFAYFETDVVLHEGSLYYTKFGEAAGDEPGVAGAWLLMIPAPPAGKSGQPVPWFEVAEPLEPMMIPGLRGATGAAGGGGGGGADAKPFTLDFGLWPVNSKRFVIADALAVVGADIMVTAGSDVPAGEPASAFDEWDMDPMFFVAQPVAAGGSFVINARCIEPRGKVIGKRVVNVLFG